VTKTKPTKPTPGRMPALGMVRSTVDMPEALWRQAKIRAIQERRDYRLLVIEAITRYLKDTK
jgi:hypothetical protein